MDPAGGSAAGAAAGGTVWTPPFAVGPGAAGARALLTPRAEKIIFPDSRIEKSPQRLIVDSRDPLPAKG